MRPGGDGTEQDQDQNDDEDCAERHRVLLAVLKALHFNVSAALRFPQKQRSRRVAGDAPARDVKRPGPSLSWFGKGVFRNIGSLYRCLVLFTPTEQSSKQTAPLLAGGQGLAREHHQSRGRDDQR